MKKTAIAILLLSFLSLACAPRYIPPIPVNARTGVSSATLAQVVSSSQTANYTVDSGIAGTAQKTYGYNSNKSIPSQYSFDVDINGDVSKTVRNYVNTKFLSITNPADVNIHVDIKDFYVEYTYKMASTAVLIMTNTYQSTEYIKAVLVVNVTIDKGGKAYTKEFLFEQDARDKAVEAMATAPQTAIGTLKERKGPDNILAEMLSMMYNDLVIKTDKFFESIPVQTVKQLGNNPTKPDGKQPDTSNDIFKIK